MPPGLGHPPPDVFRHLTKSVSRNQFRVRAAFERRSRPRRLLARCWAAQAALRPARCSAGCPAKDVAARHGLRRRPPVGSDDPCSFPATQSQFAAPFLTRMKFVDEQGRGRVADAVGVAGSTANLPPDAPARLRIGGAAAAHPPQRRDRPPPLGKRAVPQGARRDPDRRYPHVSGGMGTRKGDLSPKDNRGSRHKQPTEPVQRCSLPVEDDYDSEISPR